MRRLLVLLAVLAGLAGGAPAGAATQVGAGNQPDAVVDREGTTHLVYNESRPDSDDVLHYCRIPRGQAACTDARTFTPCAEGRNVYDVWGPHVTITPFGEVVLLTHRQCRRPDDTVDFTNIVYRSEDDGATFGPAEPIGTAEPGFPAGSTPAVLDAADRRLVTIATRTGGAWVQGAPLGAFTEAEAQLFNRDAYDPSIVQRGRGSFVASWTDLGGTTYVRTFDCAGCPLGAINDPTRWTPAVPIAEAELSRLAAGPSGTYLVYRSTAEASYRQWMARRVTGTAVGAPSPITEPGVTSPFRDVVQDPAGLLHFAAGDANNALAYRRSGDGAAWSPPTELAPGPDFGIGDTRVAAAYSDAGFTGFALWESSADGARNPPILMQALPTPPAPGTDPPPPPPPPPPDGGGGPGGTPEAPPTAPGPPSACRVLQFAAIDVVADGCLRREGQVYIARGGLAVNGLRITQGSGSAEIRFDTRARTVRSSGSITLSAGGTTLYRGSLRWDLPAGNTVDLGTLNVGAIGDKLLGFPLSGSAKLRLRRGAAEIPLHLGLPAVFGGVTGDVTLRADNLAGIHLRELHVKVGNALLGPLQVKNLKFDYDADAKTWAGGALMILPPQPPGPSLDAQVGFFDGDLDYLRNELTLPGNGLPLEPFNVVYLRKIRFSLETRPVLKLSGGVQITAGPTLAGVSAVAVDGDLSYTFPNPPEPAILRADGRVSLASIPLATAYFEFRTNGYVGFGGHLELKISDEFKVTADLNGWLYRDKFNVEAKAEICLGDLGCGSGQVVVSSVGFAGCVYTDLANFGAGYKWGETPGFDNLMFTGCSVGPYRASIAQAGGARVVRLGAGLPSAFVGVRGEGAPPRVALVGPAGQRIEPPPDGPLRTPEATAFHIRGEQSTTWFVLNRPAAGDWRVETLEGSSPVTNVVSADGLEAPEVQASVRRRGARRELRYTVKPIPGQQVRFSEEGTGVARDLGAARGEKGTLRFTPGDGPGGTRRIVAQVESYGSPRDTIEVASYVAPAPKRPKAAKRLRAARRGSRLVVTFKPVRGASRYVVRVKLSDGRSILRPLGRRTRRVTVSGLAARTTARVSVVGLRSDGLAGRTATARLRAKKARRRR